MGQERREGKAQGLVPLKGEELRQIMGDGRDRGDGRRRVTDDQQDREKRVGMTLSTAAAAASSDRARG
nr:hypothetical protein CFP56_52491 [Quercus suber]